MADSDPKRAIAEEAVLGYLQNHPEIPDSQLFADQFVADGKINHDDIANAIKSLTGHTYVDSQVLEHLDLLQQLESWILMC